LAGAETDGMNNGFFFPFFPRAERKGADNDQQKNEHWTSIQHDPLNR
jgi:hypothetical protein